MAQVRHTMLRTIFWFFYFWVSLIGLTPRLLKANRLQKSADIEQYKSLVDSSTRFWMGSLLKIAGQRVTVKGVDNVPENEAVLYVCNHQGNFDIPICITGLPGLKGFIAKKEADKIPIIRKWMRHMNCIFMDRKNPRQSVKAIAMAADSLKGGHRMVIFPEGTRSHDGKLADFKPGALKLATRTGVKVIPVTINGTRKAMKKGSLLIRPADIELVIGEPVLPVGDLKESIALTAHVRAQIQQELHDI